MYGAFGSVRVQRGFRSCCRASGGQHDYYTMCGERSNTPTASGSQRTKHTGLPSLRRGARAHATERRGRPHAARVLSSRSSYSTTNLVVYDTGTAVPQSCVLVCTRTRVTSIRVDRARAAYRPRFLASWAWLLIFNACRRLIVHDSDLGVAMCTRAVARSTTSWTYPRYRYILEFIGYGIYSTTSIPDANATFLLPTYVRAGQQAG